MKSSGHILKVGKEENVNLTLELTVTTRKQSETLDTDKK